MNESLELVRWMRRPPAKERKRAADREAKRARYHNDPAYRQDRLRRAAKAYERNQEKIRARMRVENMTPERVEQQRARQRERWRRERAERLAYQADYRNRPEVKRARLLRDRAKRVLRRLLDRLEPRPAPQRATIEARCTRAALLRKPGVVTAVPSGL